MPFCFKAKLYFFMQSIIRPLISTWLKCTPPLPEPQLNGYRSSRNRARGVAGTIAPPSPQSKYQLTAITAAEWGPQLPATYLKKKMRD